MDDRLGVEWAADPNSMTTGERIFPDETFCFLDKRGRDAGCDGCDDYLVSSSMDDRLRQGCCLAAWQLTQINEMTTRFQV